MHVLIVDDDDVLGGLLSAWLKHEELSQHHIEPIHVKSCEEGLEAAKNKTVDIILMDVGLEGMDGIEGVKLFKRVFPLSLISMISSSNDRELQEQALQAGAYDYITKPLVLPVFLHRIQSYIKLLCLRKSAQDNPNKATLFLDPVFSCQMNFFIQSEDDLLVFWDTSFNRLNLNREVSYLHNLVKQIYYTGLELLKTLKQFQIHLQESESHLYVILDTNSTLKPTDLLFIDNDHFEIKYELSQGLIGIKIEKQFQEPSDPACTPEIHPVQETPLQKSDTTSDTKTATFKEEVVAQGIMQDFKVFTLFDDDEMEDFDNELYQISSMMQYLSEAPDANYINYLHQSLQKLTSILTRYPELDRLSASIRQFEGVLTEELNSDIAWDDAYHLLNGYIEDIITWYKAVFFNGATSLNFMDDSFEANIELILTMLRPQEEQTSTDDIFDF